MIHKIFLTLLILLLNSSVNAAILSGTITLADGTPIPDMIITASVAGTDLPSATTDINGDYSLSLSSNTYDLKLSLYGYYSEEMIGRELHDYRNENIDVSTDVTYDITLDWVKITGKTTDDQGIGISGYYEINGAGILVSSLMEVQNTNFIILYYPMLMEIIVSGCHRIMIILYR